MKSLGGYAANLTVKYDINISDTRGGFIIGCLPLKQNQLPLVTSDFHETLQGRSQGEYLHMHSSKGFSIFTVKSKKMAAFLNLQGKL